MALSAADERRALMRAAERFELCRMFGGGNCRRGAFRLAVIERRATLAADAFRGLSLDGPMEKASAADQQPQGASEAAAAAMLAAPGSSRTRRRARLRKKKRGPAAAEAVPEANGHQAQAQDGGAAAQDADGYQEGATLPEKNANSLTNSLA